MSNPSAPTQKTPAQTMAVQQAKPSAAAVAGVARRAKALEILGESLKIDPPMLMQILKNQIMPNATDDQIAAIVITANIYGLNPILRELYAFPDPKRKTIVPVVGVDGWAKIVNRQDDYDGCEFEWHFEEPFSCTCKIYHKKRSKPIVVTEYFSECRRGSEPWNNMPKRMLRHKAFIQAARLAFGISGIYDEDEAKDIVLNDATVTTAPLIAAPSFITQPPTQPAPAEDDEVPGLPKQEPPPAAESTDVPAEPAQQPVDKTEGIEGVALVNLLKQLMKRDDVSEDQVIGYLRSLKPPMASAKQKELPELSDSKLRTIINTWDDVMPKAKGFQV